MAIRWRIVVTVEPGGNVYRFARENYAIADASLGGRELLVRGALASVSIPTVGADTSDAEVEVDDGVLPVTTLRAQGIILSGCPAEVALWQLGSDWTTRRILLKGRVKPDGVQRSPYKSMVRLTLGDYDAQHDLPFPRWIIDVTGFPEIDAGTVGATMPVLYGACVDVPLQLVRPSNPIFGADRARYIVAGHRVVSTSILVRPDGDPDPTRAFGLPVLYDTDSTSGAVYAYINPTDAQLQGAGSLVADVYGYADQSGSPISGLGDVIAHVLREHTTVPPERVDEDRLSRFRPRANRIVVASMFGGSSQGETAIGTIKSRYESNLPVVISWRGGRIGADYASWDPFAVAVRSLALNRELLQRLEPIELVVEGGTPYSSYRLSYGVHPYGQSSNGKPTPVSSITRSRTTGDARCSAAATRYGNVPMPPVQLVDINTTPGASAAIDALIDRYGIVRTRARYLCRIDDVVDLPLYERYDLYDGDLGLDAEPFRLDEVQFREDDLAELSFTSYRDSPA